MSIIAIEYTQTDVTVSKLHTDMLAAGIPVLGVSFYEPNRVVVEFEDTISVPHQQLAATMVGEHEGKPELRALLREINAYRDRYMYGGFIYGTYMFNSEADSLVNINGTCSGLNTLTIMEAPLPTTVPWTVASNNEAHLTPTEFRDFGLKVMNWVSEIYTACRYIKDEIITQYNGGDHSGALATNYEADPRWPARDLGGSIAAPLTVKPFNGA